MRKQQFQVLYRESLFRIVDVELLSAPADTGRLLGQFAGVLAVFSLVFSLGAFFFEGGGMSRTALLIQAWSIEHFLISTTMLVVGLFAVLSWNSIFPDRRDILILSPLPVSVRTLFLAKIAATATSLGLAILAVNIFSGLSWPLALSGGNWWILSLAKSLLAYWATMLLAGMFVFCGILSLQGIAAQLLPYRTFQRISGLLQIGAFALFLSIYFLEPHLATPVALADPSHRWLLDWLPSYWFLGLFQFINGSMHPALMPLAKRAVAGVVVAATISGVSFLLSYLRTVRKITEEPDIAARPFGIRCPLNFGNPVQAAVMLFSVRTLLRSRQHRALLCFYLGIAFAIAMFYVKTGIGRQTLQVDGVWWHRPDVPLLLASIVTMGMAILGTRITFSMPLDLKCNWIFRMISLPKTLDWLGGARRALLLIGVLPTLLACAASFFWIWPWGPTVEHLIFLALIGAILVDCSLYGFRKIPFTCSYLPGKSNVYVAFWIYVLLAIPLLDRGVRMEERMLRGLPIATTVILLALLAIAVCTRWRINAGARDEKVYFEELPTPAIFALDLHRDGMLPTGATENHNSV